MVKYASYFIFITKKKTKTVSETDLIAAAQYEWDAQEQLRIDTLAKMKIARAEYDQQMIELEIEAEKNKKLSAETKDSNKKKKHIKRRKGKKLEAPPIVDEYTVVDISGDYRKLEAKQTAQFYGRIHPETLSLAPDEVTLNHISSYNARCSQCKENLCVSGEYASHLNTRWDNANRLSP